MHSWRLSSGITPPLLLLSSHSSPQSEREERSSSSAHHAVRVWVAALASEAPFKAGANGEEKAPKTPLCCMRDGAVLFFSFLPLPDSRAWPAYSGIEWRAAVVEAVVGYWVSLYEGRNGASFDKDLSDFLWNFGYMLEN